MSFGTVQDADVITILSPADAKVVVLNATNAVITTTDPAGVSDLTAVQKIPQGTEGNFSVVVNATLQVSTGLTCKETISDHTQADIACYCCIQSEVSAVYAVYSKAKSACTSSVTACGPDTSCTGKHRIHDTHTADLAECCEREA